MTQSHEAMTTKLSRARLADRLRAKAGRSRRDATIEISRLVGGNIRAARKRLGISLDTLARASGVSRAMLGQIETTKSVPTITVLCRIAEALGVAAADLIARNPTSEAVIISSMDDSPSSPWVTGAESRVVASPQIGAGQTIVEVRLGPDESFQLSPPPGEARATLIVARGVVRLGSGDSAEHRLGERAAALLSPGIVVTVSSADEPEALIYLAFAKPAIDA